MNSVWKKDYTTQLIKESDEVRGYLDDSINMLQEQQDENYNVITNIEDMQDNW